MCLENSILYIAIVGTDRMSYRCTMIIAGYNVGIIVAQFRYFIFQCTAVNTYTIGKITYFILPGKSKLKTFVVDGACIGDGIPCTDGRRYGYIG